MSLTVREERNEDLASIRTIVQAAFKDRPYSCGAEHLIPDELRRQKALTLSLVAEEDNEIVGHIAFSPVLIESQFHGWYGLGPLSVSPDRQLQGIGSALVYEGLARMKNKEGVQGIVVLGNPDYYQKFGFNAAKDMVFPHAPFDFFLAQSFFGKFSPGTISFHDAFNIKP